MFIPNPLSMLQIHYFWLPITYLHWNVPHALSHKSTIWLVPNWTYCIPLLQNCLYLLVSWLTVRPSSPSFNYKSQCLFWLFSLPYPPCPSDSSTENSSHKAFFSPCPRHCLSSNVCHLLIFYQISRPLIHPLHCHQNIYLKQILFCKLAV